MALFETDEKGVKQFAEKIRSIVERIVFKYQGARIQRTISIGISCFPGKKQEGTIESVIQEADKALYLAKNSGKNKWVYYFDQEGASEMVK